MQWLHNIFTRKKTPKIFTRPNKHAPKPKIELLDRSVMIKGYQSFVISNDAVKPSKDCYDLEEKLKLLSPYYSEKEMKDSTFLDLGSAGGFFSFLAQLQGAIVDSVDIDLDYVKLMEDAMNHLHIKNMNIHTMNVSDWNQPRDYVNALSLIHWVYSCTSIMGSMDEMIKFFASITTKKLFIEWIDPQDEAIKYFGHLKYNKSFSDDSYSKDKFCEFLDTYFDKVTFLGESRKSTREIYLAEFNH